MKSTIIYKYNQIDQGYLDRCDELIKFIEHLVIYERDNLEKQEKNSHTKEMLKMAVNKKGEALASMVPQIIIVPSNIAPEYPIEIQPEDFIKCGYDNYKEAIDSAQRDRVINNALNRIHRYRGRDIVYKPYFSGHKQ